LRGQEAAYSADIPRATRDNEFAAGSRIPIDTLTNLQVENLATLAEVWGFLKYHHPAVTSGQHNWDFELFQVLPSILAAQNRTARNVLLLKWVESLGPVPPCSPCVKLETKGLQTAPDIAWLSDRRHLGSALSARLKTIYERRPSEKQFYLSFGSIVDNPVFANESSYKKITFPDSGYQVLALFRWWNALEWWSPNRGLDPDWHRVLRAYIRPIATARTKQEFTLEMFKLVGEARDTHANLWSTITERPPVGLCNIPVVMRFIGVDAVVWNVSDKASGLERGDVIDSIETQSVNELVQEWSPFYADSNEAARRRDIGLEMTNGVCGPVSVGIQRNNSHLQIASVRLKKNYKASEKVWHDRTGDAFQLLSREVAYLKLSSVRIEDVASYVERAASTKGMVIDIRNYPSAFVVFALGQLLVEKPTTFVRLTGAEASNPGAFHFLDDSMLTPGTPHYPGRIVILVDEQTQSSAEYTAMALRTAPGALVIGSQTAGADGNVSKIPLPFGLSTYISGIGVFTPQGGQTQRVGIIRDIEAVPTIAGITAGRDEVLETAIRKIVGTDVSEGEIERMAHR
jgi:C-terminal processing protease CtpA/Prc